MAATESRVEGERRRDARLIEMHGIGKEFLGVRVLDAVDLDCEAGEVHAIVGENGAGKSTLMKILCGAYRPSEGEIRIDGEPVSFHHPLDGQQAGVAIIYQEFNLLPDRGSRRTSSSAGSRGAGADRPRRDGGALGGAARRARPRRSDLAARAGREPAGRAAAGRSRSRRPCRSTPG